MKKCSFYYLLESLYSFTHNLFRKKKKGLQVTYICVSVNLSSALRFKCISCKSMRKSPLKSSSYHRCLCICACTHSTALQPMQEPFISFRKPLTIKRNRPGKCSACLRALGEDLNLAPKLSKRIVSPARDYEGVLLCADLLSRDTASVWKNLMLR